MTGNSVILAPTIAMTFTRVNFTSTNGDCIFACATDDPLTSINTSVTAYYGLAGSLDTLQSTETNAQVTVNNAFKFSQLTCNVISNSITCNSTFTKIEVGTKEVRLSDSVRFYQALDQSHIPVKLDVYEGMPHVFQFYLYDTSESKIAISNE